MALPVKGWPKHVGRGLRKKGGHLLFLEQFNQAWKPLTFESQTPHSVQSMVPVVDGQMRSRQGLRESSRNPPLTRAAMTRRQIAWIVGQNPPDKHTFPCYDMCSARSNSYPDNDDLFHGNDDSIGVRHRIPYMTADTERTLEAPYLDFGVSVTISGHRFIALTKDTSWIDKCKACGKIDAVEFITRCGSQKLCSRQCGQMFVRHRRYRRQIHEKPLFVRPVTSRNDRLMPDEEIVLEATTDPKRKKRKYTKRKVTSNSKESKTNSRIGEDGKCEKPVKRAYKKRSKTLAGLPKLKVKMQMKKKCQEHEGDIDTDSENDEKSEMTDDDNVSRDESVKHDEHRRGKSKVRQERRKQDLASEQARDYHVCNSTTSLHSTSNHMASSGIKLGRVKIELRKCETGNT